MAFSPSAHFCVSALSLNYLNNKELKKIKSSKKSRSEQKCAEVSRSLLSSAEFCVVSEVKVLTIKHRESAEVSRRPFVTSSAK